MLVWPWSVPEQQFVLLLSSFLFPGWGLSMCPWHQQLERAWVWEWMWPPAKIKLDKPVSRWSVLASGRSVGPQVWARLSLRAGAQGLAMGSGCPSQLRTGVTVCTSDWSRAAAGGFTCTVVGNWGDGSRGSYWADCLGPAAGRIHCVYMETHTYIYFH